MEKILCSAVWFTEYADKEVVHNPKNIEKGLVICGRRHHNCIAISSIIFDKPQKNIQGFLTSEDRFVDRKEGKLIAMSANQCEDKNPKQILFSEDLY